MIPKVIHYCWFGRNPLPPLAVKCIASWRKFLPDYEIKEWNEDNFDVNIIPYTAEAYRARKYAFVSDYARFWILYKYGGLYFDTDVEVIRPLDDIIERGAFMGCESDAVAKGLATIGANPGLGLGCAPGLGLYKKMLDYYAPLHFDPNNIAETIVGHTTKVLRSLGLQDKNGIQKVADIYIYPSEYFNPTNIVTHRLHITANTRTIHWYAGTWVDKKESVPKRLLRCLMPESVLMWYNRKKYSKKENEMRILYVTNMFPNIGDPTYGIFVKEQIDAITEQERIEYQVYAIEGRKGLWEYVKSIRNIRALIRNGNFDVVHVHYGLSGLFLLVGKPNVPVIMTLHGGDIQAEQGKTIQVALTKRILRRCDFAITLNERMDDIVKEYTGKTEIIPCSVNTNLFRPNRNNEDGSGHVKILFPSARTRVVKDYPLFQRVCKILRQKYGLEVEEFYLENLSRKEVAHLFNQMDLLLMTSVSEGSPQVVKEAMACNLPIVSTKVGDVSMLLDEVANCYVAQSRDEEELAALAYQSLTKGKINGITPQEKINVLGLDDESIGRRILKEYHEILKEHDSKGRTRHCD